MERSLLLASLLMLAACGLTDTATTAAAGGAAKARESQQLKDMPGKVQEQVVEADRKARERLEAAEREGR